MHCLYSAVFDSARTSYAAALMGGGRSLTLQTTDRTLVVGTRSLTKQTSDRTLMGGARSLSKQTADRTLSHSWAAPEALPSRPPIALALRDHRPESRCHQS